MDIILILAAIVAVFFILKIAFKALKFVLLVGIVLFLVYYLTSFGFLKELL